MNTEQVLDTVDLLETLWKKGLFYQFAYEMKDLYETEKESFIHAVMVLLNQRIIRKK